MKYKILALVGPTAVGKTEYALKLAEDLNGEIISADSVQIYKDMVIGSARPTDEELHKINHYLIGEIDPLQSFTVADYENRAKKAIKKVVNKGKLPIVSGGTGLYLNSLLYDMDFNQAPTNMALRSELDEYYKAYGSDKLHLRLRELDEEAAEKIHKNNVKRVIRAIEIVETTGKSMSQFENVKEKNKDYNFLVAVLNRDREILYKRIDKRVDIMMDQGLLDEVKYLAEKGLNKKHPSMMAIGYKEIIAYLENETTLDKAISKIKQNSRNYAKRQLTWFKRYEDAHWFDLTKDCLEYSIIDKIKDLLTKEA